MSDFGFLVLLVLDLSFLSSSEEDSGSLALERFRESDLVFSSAMSSLAGDLVLVVVVVVVVSAEGFSVGASLSDFDSSSGEPDIAK